MHDHSKNISIVFTTNTIDVPTWLAGLAGAPIEPAGPAMLVTLLESTPDALIAYVDSTFELRGVAQLLAELRRRRPNVRLAAIAVRPDDAAERAMRAAGALVFAITPDQDALAATLSDLRLLPRRVERAPPLSRLGLAPPLFPAHWDPKLRIPRGQVVAAASIVSPKY